MIKKIKISLEYNTFPIWLYNENNEIIDNDLPPEWANDVALESSFMALSKLYDTLFINTPKEFCYVGFENAKDKEDFFAVLNAAIKLLVSKNNGKYIIIDTTSKNEIDY